MTDKILALVLDYGSAIQSGNLHKSKQAYAALKELLEARECTCPAKDMPFGRCCKASPEPTK